MYVLPAPSIDDLIARLGTEAAFASMVAPIEVVPRDRYLHWDKLRHLTPPEGLSSEQWWLKIKLARSDELRRLPLADRDGSHFGYTLPDIVLRHLHHVDQRCSGEVAMDGVVTSEPEARKRYIVNSLMEEAIRSSQLEGATTSRLTAKELLRSGRLPRDRSEQMIVNNYRGLEFMREQTGASLTPDSLLELHRILTVGTLDDPASAGRLQQPGEPRVTVHDRDGGSVVHIPPPAEQLPERIQRLCDFANEDDEEGAFVHPVVRAILLHFWLAYDHPFEDGNGRTARILFFWSMLSSGYWMAEYLPISRLISTGRRQYGKAFLEAETDAGDTTYFLLHQLELIERAIEDLQSYLRRKTVEQRDVKKLLDDLDDLNGRQVVLLTHAIKHPDHTYTFGGHAHSNRVTHETARADLGALAERGLLARRRRGRSYVFEPAPDLPQRLRESPG
jgi:Fic family protein